MKNTSNLRDELIKNSFMIGANGLKEPYSWRSYAEKLEEYILGYINEEKLNEDKSEEEWNNDMRLMPQDIDNMNIASGSNTILHGTYIVSEENNNIIIGNNIVSNEPFKLIIKTANIGADETISQREWDLLYKLYCGINDMNTK